MKSEEIVEREFDGHSEVIIRTKEELIAIQNQFNSINSPPHINIEEELDRVWKRMLLYWYERYYPSHPSILMILKYQAEITITEGGMDITILRVFSKSFNQDVFTNKVYNVIEQWIDMTQDIEYVCDHVHNPQLRVRIKGKDYHAQ